MSLLDINNLSIEYETDQGPLQAVNDVGLSLEKGETLGIVGESGCGKTTLSKGILNVLPDNGTANGEIKYKGDDLTTMSKDRLNNDIRWHEISWIAQNAMNALDPVRTVKSLFRELFGKKTDLTKSEAHERTAELLRSVNIEEEVMNDYSHELSGGQRQRVIIAMALMLNPELIISDEPTTGLDVVVQDNILSTIQDIQTEQDASMIFISHDISVIAEIADKVAVMYGGKIVESGSVHDVFTNSTHPYTIGLRNAYPEIGRYDEDLISIPGSPPDLTDPPTGCIFRDRCPFSTAECEMEPATSALADGHTVKCHYPDEAAEFREAGQEVSTWEAQDE